MQSSNAFTAFNAALQ